MNNQTPITKLQLITNTHYSITKQKPSGIIFLFGYSVIGNWMFIGD